MRTTTTASGTRSDCQSSPSLTMSSNTDSTITITANNPNTDSTATVRPNNTEEEVEPRSVLDSDDSDGEEGEDYIDEEDDRSSSLSIPNESIDFDLVYSLHSFAATVDGQANVVKGDRLVLIDDSNSYWWLVRVLKTQEVGYIPAENIETPFERLARLNKHRNVDVSSFSRLDNIHVFLILFKQARICNSSRNARRSQRLARPSSPTHNSRPNSLS